MKRSILSAVFVIIGIGIFLLVKRSIPYSDRADLYEATISIDSIWTLGPAAAIYDKRSKKYYWLKSYTSLDQKNLDTLKSRKANIRYTKFLTGPLENRIFRMEVDSIVIIDQVVDRD
jgi:hypothetical protein